VFNGPGQPPHLPCCACALLCRAPQVRCCWRLPPADLRLHAAQGGSSRPPHLGLMCRPHGSQCLPLIGCPIVGGDSLQQGTHACVDLGVGVGRVAPGLPAAALRLSCRGGGGGAGGAPPPPPAAAVRAPRRPPPPPPPNAPIIPGRRQRTGAPPRAPPPPRPIAPTCSTSCSAGPYACSCACVTLMCSTRGELCAGGSNPGSWAGAAAPGTTACAAAGSGGGVNVGSCSMPSRAGTGSPAPPLGAPPGATVPLPREGAAWSGTCTAGRPPPHPAPRPSPAAVTASGVAAAGVAGTGAAADAGAAAAPALLAGAAALGLLPRCCCGCCSCSCDCCCPCSCSCDCPCCSCFCSGCMHGWCCPRPSNCVAWPPLSK